LALKSRDAQLRYREREWLEAWAENYKLEQESEKQQRAMQASKQVRILLQTQHGPYLLLFSWAG
jgi:hypothetical protein